MATNKRKSIRSAKDKPLLMEEQRDMTTQFEDTISTWRHHWDKTYEGSFVDYRLMAAGRLPVRIQQELSHPEFDAHSKIIPRLIPDAIKYMVTTIDNSIFNTNENPFDFVGRDNKNDHSNARNAYDLVSYEMEVTNARKEMKMCVKDAVVVGAGFVERAHHREMSLNPRYRKDSSGRSFLDIKNYDITYVGPKLNRIQTEQVLLDPYAREFDKISGYAKNLVVPYSSVIKEGLKGGLYNKYAKNISKIDRSHFDTQLRDKYDIYDDHRLESTDITLPDFPVLITEYWMSMDIEGKIPAWHVITVANYNMNPLLLRYEMDPMQTGTHPLTMCVVYPKNDRIMGECIPEMANGYMLEQFAKRNQRINLVNIAAAVGGMVFMPQQMINKSSILTKLRKAIPTHGPGKGQVDSIKLDLSAYPALLNEEAMIRTDAEQSLSMNKISLGQSPERRETATTTATVDENAKIMANDPIAEVEDSLIVPVAKGFILHSQLLVPTKFKVRIIGRDNQLSFRNMKKEDILGLFDVKCYASSRLLTKAIKQAMFNNLAQLYLPNPSIRMDRQEFALRHFKLYEIGDAEKIIDTTTDLQIEIERENSMLLNDVHIPVLPHEPHQDHYASHMNKANEAMQAGATEEDVFMLVSHAQEHEKVLMIQQGQLTPGAGANQPNPASKGALLNRINTDSRARIPN